MPMYCVYNSGISVQHIVYINTIHHIDQSDYQFVTADYITDQKYYIRYIYIIST